MTDVEKVKKGLECCKASTNDDPFQGCSECPYNYISISVQECRAVLSADALELLKEQEPVEPIYGTHGERRCGVCRNAFFVYGQLYCASCGRAVKWDG